MHCIHFSDFVNKCLESTGIKRKPRKQVDISAPFDFKAGPTMHFPGYSEDDISLMREKAIASTAIVNEDSDFDLTTRIQRPHSRASSHDCGFGKRMTHHARRVSKTFAI
ncbi:hypothetical protein BJ878DRAFT_190163 [Calycina marina]|uniref:Uncharacterized protein n=1 Tax=Calycina marina TaxID=1763456 RepID=A0A9P8CI12_9HELO|nr:hypothetical protein BJ878DRAFT_190163 [Calycina marina]